MHKLVLEFKDKEVKKEELIKHYNLTPKQVDEWLKLAVEKNELIKKQDP